MVDGPEPSRGSSTSISMGSGSGGSWPLESERGPRSWDLVASWLTGPGLASGSSDSTTVLASSQNSRAGWASGC
jgi:hypothetical protein